jgi:hypothetical protein
MFLNVTKFLSVQLYLPKHLTVHLKTDGVVNLGKLSGPSDLLYIKMNNRNVE